ncbi:hypothetical protein CspeluHIS016_0305070 [Cutaneotrichosporon spelunceum]|uniref:Uncharacterized protein n=1 Tax=Cutaneotrichosporon spelunceum TaxID=1672016 RepID=A0AAD3TUB3_9TREE|nr:hypothetical protein CspeluHIS016_0305070 [Cutaneotrichosporon spelunceum]
MFTPPSTSPNTAHYKIARMEDSEDGTPVAAAVPRRIVYSPFAENAEAGPSRPRLSPSARSQPLADGPNPDAGDERLPERGAASEDLDDAESGGSPSSDIPKTVRKRRPGPPRTRFRRADVSDTPGLSWFTAELKLHQSVTTRHFRGVYSEEVNPVGWEASISAPMMTRWTPDEKGLFFAAIARHSRLRPDLIAHDIRTKTELEVSQYIDLIEASIQALPDIVNHHSETQQWRDRLLGSGAYETPQGFVEKEEHLAELVELLDYSAMEEKQAGFPRVPGRRSRRMTRESRAAVEKWGETFTVDKMELTADLISVAANNERLKATAMPQLDGGDEMDQITADNGMIELITGIPKKERTAFQSKTLRTLVNRCNMRQKYRRKRLHAQGWTDDRIDAQGGPDSVFVAAKAGGGARRKGPAAGVKVDPALAELQDLGLEAYLENRGWEVFNYDRMPQFIELCQNAYGVEPTTHTYNGASISTARGTSFNVLFLLYKALWAYLRGLLIRTYIIASSGDSHTTEIQKWQVEAALEAFGIPDPRPQLDGVVKEVQRLAQMACDREAGVELELEPPRQPEPAEGESESEEDQRLSDGQGDRVVKRRMTKKRRACLSVRDAAVPPPVVVEPPPDSDVWVPFRSETDDEDSELDERLNAVDTALDAVMASQLRGAAESHRVMRLDDHAWLDTRSNRGRGWRKARALVPVPFNERADLARAQKSYRELMARVTSDRRHRRKMAERSMRYPRHQAELAAMRNHRNPPVPLHVLGDEWMEDGVVHERPLTIATKATLKRKRAREAEYESDEEDVRQRDGTELNKRQKTAEEPLHSRQGSLSNESEEWEASGDSSGAMTTDDEDEPAYPPGTPGSVSDGASDDENMDVSTQLVDRDGVETAEVGVAMEVLGSDDALDSSDEADDEDVDDKDDASSMTHAEDEGGDAGDAADDDDADDADGAVASNLSDDGSLSHTDYEGDDVADDADDRAVASNVSDNDNLSHVDDESDDAHGDQKADISDEADGDNASLTGPANDFAQGLVRGDDAFGSDSGDEQHEVLSEDESGGEATANETVNRDDGSDAESNRRSDRVPNGHASSPGSLEHAHAPNGSVSPRKSPNGLAAQSSPSGSHRFQKDAHSDDETSARSDDEDERSQHLLNFDGSDDERNASYGSPGAAPEESRGGDLLGGDDALDSDSD